MLRKSGERRLCKYIALLRGVNVGGNNTISMPALKAMFEKDGFARVSTYINSGNVLFDSDLDETEIQVRCEQLIADAFRLNIPVCVLSAQELTDALTRAPDWWNADALSKHDALFVIPPMTAEQVFAEMGEVRLEFEKVAHHGKVILWSAPLATFSRTRWSKISQHREAYERITIRNANTAVKLAEMGRAV